MGADGSGQPDRVCSLSGPRDAIQRAKDMIYSIVQTHQRPLDSPPPPQHPPTNSNSSSLNSGNFYLNAFNKFINCNFLRIFLHPLYFQNFSFRKFTAFRVQID